MGARDRQDALLGWLRGRGAATVAEIAERFEVDARTVYRDLAALRERGVALDGEPGRGGGIRLDPSAALPPVQLEVDEVIGVVMAVALASCDSPMVFGASARQAVDKLIGALPPARARNLRRLLARVLLAQPASPAVRASLGPIADGVLQRLEQAFDQGRVLGFAYLDRHGQASTREVEVHGLLAQSPAWYLLARDRERAAPRMFRLDRIRGPALLEASFRPRPLAELASLIDAELRVRRLL